MFNPASGQDRKSFIMENRTIKIDYRDHIAILRMDKPPANTIDLALLKDAEDALSDLQLQANIKAVVITGTGKCFCAGADLKTVPQYSQAQQREVVAAMNRIITHLYTRPYPLIAAVNGHAIAAGLVLVLACDYRIGADTGCKFGLTEIRAGIPFPAATMEILKAELPAHVTRRLALTGRNISPTEALTYGIFDELQPAEQVLLRALEVANDLSISSAHAYATIKMQLRADTIKRIEHIMDADPLLASWLTEETKTASTHLLSD
jgi:enoyl-CoA hydratase